MSAYRILKSVVIGEENTCDVYGWQELAAHWSPPDDRSYVRAQDLGEVFGTGRFLVLPASDEWGRVEEKVVVPVTTYEFEEVKDEVPA